MEPIVASLLAAFEQGQIDRRHLVRSIAIAAVGGWALATPGSALAAASHGGVESHFLFGC